MKSIQAVLHENLAIIEVTEPVLLNALLADPQTAPSILVRLSDHVAIIAPGQFEAVLARLRKHGHTPRVVQE
jgi:hypothetical protein